jgi:HEXXH motif-containing protein
MTVTAHYLPGEAFDALARGRGDVDTVRALMAGQRSRNLLLVREVVLSARKHPDTAHAAGLHRAVAALDEVQRNAPGAAAQVLSYPLVGAWAAHCLRRLRSPSPEHREVPLWVDLAQLNAVAAAAALVGRQPVDVRVPTRSGRVHLPTLGRAMLAGRAAFGDAQLFGDGHGYHLQGLQSRLRLPGPDEVSSASRAWTPLIRWRFSCSGRELDAVLDCLDPYRDCHGLTSADGLTSEEERGWYHLLGDAWDLLCRRHPGRADELSAGPLVLVPLVPLRDGPGVNATARDSTGAIAMSPPVDAVDLAQSLVHEFQHSKLGALLDLVNLYDLEDRRRFYSPWRADPRPLGGLLQAVYAFLAVAEFWRRQLQAGAEENVPLCLYKLARSREQLVETLRTLRTSGSLTSEGDRFVDVLHEEVERIHTMEFPQEARVRTSIVNRHHRVTWRLRNLFVPERQLSALATAYLAGDRPPLRADDVDRQQAESAARYEEEPLDELARLELADTLTRTRTRRNRNGPNNGDIALLHRDYTHAAKLFEQQVMNAPDDLTAWAGLAVARQYQPTTGGRTYLEAPEVLAELFARLYPMLGRRTPTPDDLARWLG